MNIAKNINNNDMDDFDDMTFDDMDFDDAESTVTENSVQVQPVDMQSNQQTAQEIYEQSQQQFVEETQQNQFNQQINMNEAPALGKQKKVKTPKAPKAPKPPKVKKEKAPKATKIPKQKKGDNQQVNSNLQLNNGNNFVDDEEVPKDKKKIFIIVGGIIVGVLVLAGLIMIMKPKNTDKHIVVAESQPVATEEPVEDTTYSIEVTDSSGDEEEPKASELDNFEVITGDTMKLNKVIEIPVVVNTKLDGEAEYTDHPSTINVGYTNFVYGYDNVIPYIEKYNLDSTHRISVKDKDEFYATSEASDMAMLEFTVAVPNDFPTSDTKHGYTGTHPEFTLSIAGTEVPETLITEMYEYALPSITSISDDLSEIYMYKSYKVRYILVLPNDLQSEAYSLTLSYKNGIDSKVFSVENFSLDSLSTQATE